MRFIISLILNALALWVVTLVYHGVHADTTTALIIAALVLGIVNAIVRPILLLLTLPFVILTLGLFIFVINGMARHHRRHPAGHRLVDHQRDRPQSGEDGELIRR